MMRVPLLFLFLITPLFATGPATTNKNKKKQIDPKLAELVDAVDRRTEEITSLRASFIQRRESNLLKEPSEMRGTFSIRRPDGMRFDFEEIEDLLIVINTEEMVTISHKAKQASRLKMQKRRTRFVQRLLSDKLGSLTKYFDISFLDADEGHNLKLTPAKRRLKKRFHYIDVHLTDDHLIEHIKVSLTDGDIYELTLEKMEVNVPMPRDFFTAKIPDGYAMGERAAFIIGLGDEL